MVKTPKRAFRSQLEMGLDSSLIERAENIAHLLLRAKGKYRERLIDIALELGPLRCADFTEDLVPVFVELEEMVEKYRTDIKLQFGHFSDPSPADRERIAFLVLELVKGCAIAEKVAEASDLPS